MHHNRSYQEKEQRLFCRLSAAVAIQEAKKTAGILEESLDLMIDVLRLKEVILQNYLFSGFPTTIEGLIVFKEALRRRGVSDENYDEPRSLDDVRSDGEALCRLIYGKNFDKLMDNMLGMSTDIHRWMLEEGYGKVLSRPVLSPLERELSVISALAALGRERQLVSHTRGALNVGSTEEQLIEAIRCIEDMMPQDQFQRMVAAAQQAFYKK